MARSEAARNGEGMPTNYDRAQRAYDAMEAPGYYDPPEPEHEEDEPLDLEDEECEFDEDCDGEE